MKTEDLLSPWNTKRRTAEAERKRIDKRIETLTAKRDRLPRYAPSDLATLLGEAVVAEMPDRRFQVLGPFGLSSDVSLHFSDETGRVLSSLTLRTYRDDEDWTFALVDESSDTKQYGRGSIGARNGFDQAEMPIPGTIAEIVELLRSREAKDPLSRP